MHRQRQHAGIEAAFAEPAQDFLGLLLEQQQLQARPARMDARHHVRQQVGAERGEQADAQAAGFRIPGAAGDLPDLVGLTQDGSGAFDHLAADFGQQHLARLRSNSSTPSSSSSLRTWVDRVG